MYVCVCLSCFVYRNHGLVRSDRFYSLVPTVMVLYPQKIWTEASDDDVFLDRETVTEKWVGVGSRQIESETQIEERDKVGWIKRRMTGRGKKKASNLWALWVFVYGRRRANGGIVENLNWLVLVSSLSSVYESITHDCAVDSYTELIHGTDEICVMGLHF